MRVFVHLLLTANHADQRWMGFTIKRGQVVCGRNSLSKSLNISEQSIKTALRSLKSTNEITIQSTNRFSVVTICNYDNYQSKENPINQPDNQLTNQQLTSNQPATNHKQECKNEKNEKNKTPEIVELIYNCYPKKVDRPSALRAILKAIRKFDGALVLEKTKAFASAWNGSDLQFCPYPATWYNGERFNDDPATWGPKETVGDLFKPKPKEQSFI